jgi:hypothetical protein
MIVYRVFDCYDPAARAPTPLPPIFLEDSSPLFGSGQEFGYMGVRIESPAQIRFASEAMGGTPVTVLQDDLFRGYKDRERLLGKMEGIQLASRQQGIELSQSECYRLCGIPYPGTVSQSVKRDSTPPSVPRTEETSESPLSDCPSDLSDWEHDKRVRLEFAEHFEATMC